MAALINFSGLASGIDSNSLIKAILDSERKARVVPLEDRISNFEDSNSAFDELALLLEKLKTSASKFRAVNGGILAKIGGSSDETILTATAANAATNGTYSVNVSQLAKNATFSFNDRFSSDSAVINSAINNGASQANRTVTITTGTGSNQESVNVVLTNTTTLSQFVDSFNSASAKSEASLINVGTTSSPSYALVINSNNQGTELGQIATSVGSEIQTAGAGAFTANTLNQATNATFTVSGISGTITRATNTPNDVIAGVTLGLQSTGTATVTISDDPDTTLTSVQDFVDAYNDIVKFISENDLVAREEDGEDATNIFGPLSSTSLDESILSSLRSAMVNSGTTGNTVNILADLGITTARDGTLELNTDVFKKGLTSDSEGARALTENLGEALGAVDGTIAQYTRFGGLLDLAINSNKTLITDMQNRIDSVERSLSEQESTLISQYSRLESLVGQLNSQQGALQSILPK